VAVRAADVMDEERQHMWKGGHKVITYMEKRTRGLYKMVTYDTMYNSGDCAIP
jgi:hypothetical protein